MAVLTSKNTFSSSIAWTSGELTHQGIPLIHKKRVTPGNNIIPDDLLNKMLKVNFTKRQVALGKYIIQETPVEIEVDPEKPDYVQAAQEIKQMTVREASAIILGEGQNPGVLSLKVLEEIKKIDSRRGIKHAIKTQISILKDREDEPEG